MVSMDIGVEKVSSLLGDLHLAEKHRRTEAEACLVQAGKENPNGLILTLLAILKTEVDEAKRQQGAIVLKNALKGPHKDEYMGILDTRVSPEVKQRLREELFAIGVHEQSLLVREVLVVLLAEVGADFGSEWKELPKLLLQVILRNESVGQQIFALKVLSLLVFDMEFPLDENEKDLAQLLKGLLTVDSMELVMAALEFLMAMLKTGDRDTFAHFQEFQPILLFIMDRLSLAAQQNSMGSEPLATFLKIFMEGITWAASFFKGSMEAILEKCMVGARNEALEMNCRELFAEVLVLMVGKNTKAIQTQGVFLESLVDLFMTFMLETEDDPDWDSEDTLTTVESAADGERDLDYSTVEKAEVNLDHITNVLTGEVMMPIIFRKIGEFMRHDSWKHKTSALMTVFETIEYLPEDRVETQLGDVVDLVVSQATHAHRRVRFSALKALAQMSLDHQPFLQHAFHEKIMPVLLLGFDDPVARVRSQAFSAFVNFAELLDVDDLEPMVPAIMVKIFAGLQVENPQTNFQKQDAVQQLILEQCITATAVVSGVLCKKFLPWYPKIVPMMKHFVDLGSNAAESKDTPRHKRIAGRALECLSIIAISVGVENMEPDASQLLPVLFHLFKTDFESKYALRDYAYESLCKMIPLVGDKVAAFVTEIVPFLIEQEAAALQPLNQLILTERNPAVESTETVLRVLTALIKAAGPSTMTWVENCVVPTFELTKVIQHGTIRFEAFSCLAAIMQTSRDNGAAPAVIASWLKTCFDVVFQLHNPADVAADENEDLRSPLDARLTIEGLARCVKAAGPGLLTKEEVLEVCRNMFQMIHQAQERSKNLRKSLREEEMDMDEEEQEKVEEELDEIQMLRETTVKILEGLAEHHAEQFLSPSNGAQLCAEFIQKCFKEANPPEEDLCLALHVCCELVEKLKTDGLRLITPFMRDIFVLATHKANDVRQPACFVMSLCIREPNIDSAVVRQAVTTYETVLCREDATDTESLGASENAVAGLFFGIKGHPKVFSLEELRAKVDLILRFLPFKVDEVEGTIIHGELLKIILQDEGSIFWGLDQANAPKLLSTFALVYKTDFSDEDVDKGIQELWRKIGRNLPTIRARCQNTVTEQIGFKRIQRDLTQPIQ